MEKKETVQDYLSRASSIVNKMKSYGEKISDQTVVEKILRTLTEKFEHVVSAILEAHDMSTYSFDELMSSLQTHEERLNRKQEKEEEKAFQVKGEVSKEKTEFSHGRGNGRGGYRGRGRGGHWSSPGVMSMKSEGFSGGRPRLPLRPPVISSTTWEWVTSEAFTWAAIRPR